MLKQQQLTFTPRPPSARMGWCPVSQQCRHVHKRPSAVQFDTCTVAAVASNISAGGLYEVGQFMNSLVQQELTDVSPASCGLVLLAGLLTSVSPCTLSVLPLTIGYIAGYSDQQQPQQPTQHEQQRQQLHQQQDCCDTPASPGGLQHSTASNSSSSTSSHSVVADQEAAASHVASPVASSSSHSSVPSSSSDNNDGSSSSSSSSSSSGLTQAVCFSLGLASSLAALGVVSSSLGRAYGAIGSGLPTLVALVAVLMGLNLLEVVRVPLPSLFGGVDVRAAGLPPQLTAYAAGALFALAASPCSTPVLASILAYASTQESPFAGGLLLFLYSCGYVAPLLVAATATGAAKRLLELRQYSAWVTPASGVLLVSGGTYALLSRLLPSL